MENLIEKNGKFYAPVNWFILPTEEPSGLFIQTHDWRGDNVWNKKLEYTTNETLIRNNHLINSGKASTNCIDKYEFYNIYITTDEDPQEGDWCITNYGVDKVSKVGVGGIRYFDNLSMCWNTHEFESNGVKKIISCTDKSLKFPIPESLDMYPMSYTPQSLPQLSKESIEIIVESYNNDPKSNNILVEVETSTLGKDFIANQFGAEIMSLIISSDNTVNITKKEETEKDKLKKLSELLKKHGVRQYLNVNNSGYSQIERDIVDLFKS